MPSCVPKHRQHATYLWIIFIALTVRTKKKRVRTVQALMLATKHPVSRMECYNTSHMFAFSVHFAGATVVSWRVNNQEQLFVRWVLFFFTFQSFDVSLTFAFVHISYRTPMIFQTFYLLFCIHILYFPFYLATFISWFLFVFLIRTRSQTEEIVEA